MDIWQTVAFVLSLVSVTLTSWLIILHVLNFSKPYLQRYIIRILLMVPIYTIDAWIVMMVPESSIFLDSFREIYESFVIYSFMKYLLNFLHYDTNLQQYINHKKGPKHIFPFCFLPSCTSGQAFMIRCKHGILQYVLIRPITTLIAFASQIFGFYGEGNYNPFSGYTYPILLIFNNASQIMAMYSLVIFYTGYRQELQPMKPLSKFFSIKLVIFFSFFQSVLISGLLEIQMIEEILHGLFPELTSKLDVGKKLQEFLICLDMLVAAIGHQWAFSHKPFVEEDERHLLESNSVLTLASGVTTSSYGKRTCCDVLFSLLDFSDEKSDVNEHFSQIFSRIKKIFTRSQGLPTVVSNDQLENGYTAGNSNNINSTKNEDDKSMGKEQDHVTISHIAEQTNTIKNYESLD